MLHDNDILKLVNKSMFQSNKYWTCKCWTLYNYDIPRSTIKSMIKQDMS
jgi:hypothetical protein